MTKFMMDKFQTPANSDEYRKNWAKAFGKEEPEQLELPLETPQTENEVEDEQPGTDSNE